MWENETGSLFVGDREWWVLLVQAQEFEQQAPEKRTQPNRCSVALRLRTKRFKEPQSINLRSAE